MIFRLILLQTGRGLQQRDAKLHFLVPLKREDAQLLKTDLTRYVYALKVICFCCGMAGIFTQLYQVRKGSERDGQRPSDTVLGTSACTREEMKKHLVSFSSQRRPGREGSCVF